MNKNNPAGMPERATLGSLQQEWQEWESDPIGGDPRLSAFGIAAARACNEIPAWKDAIALALDFRHSEKGRSLAPREVLTTKYGAYLIQKCAQIEFLKIQGENDYPLPQIEPGVALGDIDDIFLDPRSTHGETREETFFGNLVFRNIQSTVESRYGGIYIAHAYHKDRLPRNLKVFESGSSLMVGWSAVILGKRFNIDVKDADPELNQQFNDTINQTVNVDFVVGNDLHDYRSPVERSNIRSDSFRPTELLNSSRVAEFDQLATASLSIPELSYVRGNFATEKTLTSVEETISNRSGDTDGTVDMVNFFTTLYECSPSERNKMIMNATRLLNPDHGVIIFQEPAILTRRAKLGFRLTDNFRIEGVYKLFSWFPHDPGSKPELLAIYANTRCKEAEIPAPVIKKIIENSD